MRYMSQVHYLKFQAEPRTTVNKFPYASLDDGSNSSQEPEGLFQQIQGVQVQ